MLKNNSDIGNSSLGILEFDLSDSISGLGLFFEAFQAVDIIRKRATCEIFRNAAVKICSVL
ncbi:hypothetical protein ACFLZI_00680 [Nitrospirota bacterium]